MEIHQGEYLNAMRLWKVAEYFDNFVIMEQKTKKISLLVCTVVDYGRS